MMTDNPGNRADNAIRNTNALNNIYIEGLSFYRGIKLYDGKHKSFWTKSARRNAASIAHRDGNVTIRVKVIGG